MNIYEFLLKLIPFIVNDKILVIVAVTAITIISIYLFPEKGETIVTSAFTGLFGLAVGRAMSRQTDQQNGGVR